PIGSQPDAPTGARGPSADPNRYGECLQVPIGRCPAATQKIPDKLAREGVVLNLLGGENRGVPQRLDRPTRITSLTMRPRHVDKEPRLPFRGQPIRVDPSCASQ